ncbi:DUF4328 domain-containing protein, partial [Mycolicibacterium flavescens]
PAAAPGAPARPSASLPPGYRWIAVRPGAPPPPRRTRRHLGPTPRYTVIPRWGLVDQVAPADAEATEQTRSGPSRTMVRNVLLVTMLAFGAAALIHLVRYVLLIVNRSVLLHPWIAAGATWLGVALSVVAVFTLVASLMVLANWLVARRAAAYAHRGGTDPRPAWLLQAGCLVPFVNLLWAPVFAIELAGVEERLSHLRRPIAAWWVVWLISYALSIWSIATSFTTDAQGIADNTVTTIVAYLAALAALLLAAKVVDGFERQPVERPSKRWVMVPDDRQQDDEPADAPADAPKRPDDAPVESEGQNPAA